MNKSVVKMSVEEAHKVRVSKHLVQQVFKHADMHSKDKREGFFEEQLQHFLAAFVGSLVYAHIGGSVLSDKLTEEEKVQLTFKKFASVKEDVQNAVAAGVGSATMTFSGQQIEYYCQLKVVPPVANKEPC